MRIRIQNLGKIKGSKGHSRIGEVETITVWEESNGDYNFEVNVECNFVTERYRVVLERSYWRITAMPINGVGISPAISLTRPDLETPHRLLSKIANAIAEIKR